MQFRAAIVALVLGMAACVSSVECRDSVDPMEGQQCVGRGGAAAAIATAAAATVAWTAVGCRVNGCRSPYICNPESGFCEAPRCSEGNPCAPGYACDYDEGRCE